MSARHAAGSFVLAALLALGGCAPDYGAVRSWARTASLGSEYATPGATATPQAVAAMQQALTRYLAALATLAADGVVACEGPCLRDLAEAASGDPDAAAAIVAVGARLQRAVDTNARAPQLRETIRSADAPVQRLVAGLAAAVAPPTTGAAQPSAALVQYRAVLVRIGEGHALLAARARRITQRESIRNIADSEDQLRRAILALHPGAPPSIIGPAE